MLRQTVRVAILAAGVAWAMAAARPPFALADELRVLDDRAEVAFAERLAFALDVESDRPIDDVVLRYRISGDLPVNRRIPSFQRGRHVEARHEETIDRGQIPPAAEITWWWSVTDDTGRTTDTAPRTVRYLDEKYSWRSTQADGVRVWWYGDREAEARHVSDAARGAMDRLSELVGTAPTEEVEIVTYAGQDDMRRALAARGDAYEARLATLGARVAPHILLLDVGTRSEEIDDILAHELTHVALGLHLGRDYISAPLWLEEGLAMYVEGPLAADEQQDLDAAIADDRIMSVRSLSSFPGQPELVPLAYAESRDIVAFLVETRGEGRFRDLIDGIGEGLHETDDVLRTVYGMDQLGLYQAYRAARGLGPAQAPAAAEPRRRGTTGAAIPCGSVALVLPAMAAAAWRLGSRRAASPTDTGPTRSAAARRDEDVGVPAAEGVALTHVEIDTRMTGPMHGQGGSA